MMRVEISESEDWIVVDGPCGTECIPCFVCGEILDYDEYVGQYGCDDGYTDAAFAEIAEYAENGECYTIEQVTGYAGRLSAPGYIDCTEWMGPYDSAEEARREVIAQYDLCPACDGCAQGPKSDDNPACNFYHY